MYYLTHIFLLVFVLTESVRSECNDCVSTDFCPNAQKMMLDKTKKNVNLLRKVQCGYDGTGADSRMKVCCSMLSTTDEEEEKQEIEDIRVANHKNLELLNAECGYIKGDRIWGGDIADLYEFPWMALISYNTRNGRDFLCGGSIINERYILTAAHCVWNKTIAGVRVGEYDIDSEYDCQNGVCEDHLQDIAVQERKIHAEYVHDIKGIHDIALLRLEEDIDFNHANVRRICLPTTKNLRSKDLINKKAVVAGWGANETAEHSKTLLKAKVSIHSQQYCRSSYRRQNRDGYPEVTKNQFCAGGSDKDSCQGDSGGPLIVESKYNDLDRYVQYGIISHGLKYCGSSKPGLYVDVRLYMGWILDSLDMS